MKKSNITVFTRPRLQRICIIALCSIFFNIAPVSCTKKAASITIHIAVQKTHLIPLSVETAVSAAEQQQGFMNRKHIPDGTGMIFIYGRDSKLSFWMKNTPHPLSIAFIDSQGNIREIRDMQPFSMETISSTHSVRYALEVPQGYFSRAGIGIGDKLTSESIQALQEVSAKRERVR